MWVIARAMAESQMVAKRPASKGVGGLESSRRIDSPRPRKAAPKKRARRPAGDSPPVFDDASDLLRSWSAPPGERRREVLQSLIAESLRFRRYVRDDETGIPPGPLNP